MSIPRPEPIDDDEDAAFLAGRVETVSFSPKTLSLDEINEQARVQQERVFENEETIRQSYRKLECGKQTIEEFQATLAGLGLRETRALRKVLRETAQGATATYSKFIKALTMPDSSDPSEAHNDPGSCRRVSAAPQASNTIPTLEDEYNALTQPRARSKHARPEYATDTDVLTWSTPEKARDQAAGKGRIGSADRMAATDVIPTFKPPPSPFKASPSSATGIQKPPLSPATAQNQLIQSFLGDSITGAEFKGLLEESGIGSSARLDKLIERKEMGGRARFTDIKQELAYIQSNPQYQHQARACAAESVHRATVDIFDMEGTAPSESPGRNAPHSKEQCDDLRKQQDVLTWVDSPKKAFVPGKRVGCHDQHRDVIKWEEEGAASAVEMQADPSVAGGPAAPSPSRAPKVGGRANVTSGNIFTWGEPEAPQGRRRAQAPQSSVPWGTIDDMHSDINPHLSNLTKRTPK